MEPQTDKRRILVVDDEPVITHVCQKVLTKQGFYVTTASDSKKAIENLDDQQYELCILDLHIPGIDGIQLYQYIVDNIPELSRSVIFITADANSFHVSSFLNSPEKVYLQKPFTAEDLIAAVEMALNKNSQGEKLPPVLI
jgi:DNA-binding response OmpR family regulator